MARLFATVARVAETRVRNIGRRAALRGTLIGACALASLLCAGFVLAAVTVALAERVGTVGALAIMAAVALVLALILVLVLQLEARRHRRSAALRASLDRQLYRAAALSAIPSRAPSRPAIGIGLVALGAFLVLARRSRGEDDD